MKRRTLLIIYGVLALSVLITTGIIASKANKAKDTVPTPVQSEDQYNGLVATIEGTTTDMLSADHWIGEEGSVELFSPEEIEALNRNNPPYVKYYSEEEMRDLKLLMYELPESVPGGAVEALISDESKSVISERKETLYINGEVPSDDYFTSLQSLMAMEAIPENVTPRYAVCVQRCVAKTVPSEDFAADDPDEIFFNSYISAEVMPYTGVAILHESADSEWYYILNGTYCGWVKKDTVAVCKDKDEWLSVCEPEDFLVVTGNEIVMDETAQDTFSAGIILPMGTRIALTKEPSESVNGRSAIGCYCVDVPYRDEAGNMAVEKSLIPLSKDVHVGYMAMTSEAVIRQAFKFLGRVYGSGGDLLSNDCSGYLRQVYSCFGFELPRNAKAIAEMSDLGSINCEKMTTEKKKSLVTQMTPGLPLYMDGHIMMYLGTEGGEPYVISSCATTIEPGHETSDIMDAYCVFVSGMNLKRASGVTWLDDISYILWKEY